MPHKLAAVCLLLSAAATALGQSVPERSSSLYLNVCRDTPYGMLKPTDDIADALQWAIDSQRQGTGFKPYVPAGVWSFGKTLRIPNREGGCLLGMGRGENNSAGTGTQTTLIYTGDPSEPALLYQGNSWKIEDLCLCGRPVYRMRAKAPRPSIGVLSTTIKDKRDPRYQITGTTQLHLKHVEICGFEIGFQNGSNEDTTNSDMHTFTDCRFRDCQTGFWNKNRMGMEIAFQRISVGPDVEHTIRFDAGGTLYVHSANMYGKKSNTKFLVLGGPYVGLASGGFYIDGIKVDGGIDGTSDAELVHMLEPAGADIVIEKARFSNAQYGKNGGKMATLKGDTTLTIRDSYRPARIECESERYFKRTLRPHVLIDNCRLVRDRLDVTGPHTLIVRDSVYWNRKRDDISKETIELVPTRTFTGD